MLGLIKQRAAQRSSGITIDVIEAGDEALIVTRAGAPSEGELPATLITFRGGLIIKMHQFRSSDEALKAGLISMPEARLLKDALAARLEAIEVDVFTSEQYYIDVEQPSELKKVVNA